MDGVQLGLGLVSIGRTWGHSPALPPAETEARALLEEAFRLGIVVYDTAPAYGTSEERFGAFLRTLTQEQRETIFVATKFGEHWNEDGTTRVDHSYDALMRSLDRSVELLRDIDLIQVHKASVEALRSEGLKWALEAVQAMEIPQIGASVSDAAAARLAIEMGFHWLQFPFNLLQRDFLPVLELARAKDIRVMTNRALANGAALAGLPEMARMEAIAESFRFIRQHHQEGAVLTGTKSLGHLRESVELWHKSGGAS